jgi:UDP-glucose 4-epimerase
VRIVVTGATGNVGTALLRRLAHEPRVAAVAGIARRLPREPEPPPYANVDWHSIDIGADDAVEPLARCFAGAAAVVHLAWQIQPSHDRTRLRRTNVGGTAEVARAVVRAGVPALIVASSVGAYAPGPKDRFVAEDWPVTGVPGSSYSQDKAEQEAVLDDLERDQPALRVVRLRPALTFQRAAASEIARFFIGPLVPLRLLRRGLPVVPSHPRLRSQGVHADDVADAYARAVLSDVRGPFNVAAEPVLDANSLTRRFGGWSAPIPPALLRLGAAATWHARLQPVDAGWVRMGQQTPLMTSRRAESELGWRPTVDALTALAELFDAMADRSGTGSPALRPDQVASRIPGHGDPY